MRGNCSIDIDLHPAQVLGGVKGFALNAAPSLFRSGNPLSPILQEGGPPGSKGDVRH